MSRLTRDGIAESVSRYQILRCERGVFMFPVQLTTSRIGNLTRLILAVAKCDPYIHTYIHRYEWHIMTRMTGPDCAVMYNLINKYIYIHIYSVTSTIDNVSGTE